MAVSRFGVSVNVELFPGFSDRPLHFAKGIWQRDASNNLYAFLLGYCILLCTGCRRMGTLELSKKAKGQSDSAVLGLLDCGCDNARSRGICSGLHGARAFLRRTIGEIGSPIRARVKQ